MTISNVEEPDGTMTTLEAAQQLAVSESYVIKLLNEHKMGFRRVGAHRRIRIKELEVYKKEQDRESYAAMTELQAMAQEEELL